MVGGASHVLALPDYLMARIANRVVIAGPPGYQNRGSRLQETGLRFLCLHASLAIHLKWGVGGAFGRRQIGVGGQLELRLRRLGCGRFVGCTRLSILPELTNRNISTIRFTSWRF